MKIVLTESQYDTLQQSVNEMGPRDWRVRAILHMYDSAESDEERDEIASIVTFKKNSDRNKILDELLDMGYDEISIVAADLGLYPDD
jgi:hypothetical protein